MVQCIGVIRTRRSCKNPVKYGLRVELQKTTSQNKDLQESDQQNIDLQEANPQGMESQEAVSSDLCLQGAVIQDLGLKEAVPEVEEVQSLLSIEKFSLKNEPITSTIQQIAIEDF